MRTRSTTLATASRIDAGRLFISSTARLVSTSSGKAELSFHLIPRTYATSGNVFIALF
jgi:hypothetical protein